MTDQDLDESYTRVCEAMASAGEARAPLFLAMLCVSLMSRFGSAAEVLPLIANAQAQLGENDAEGAADARQR
ncbi:MAG: hypothetical protein EOO28_13035 [Comamonadaceae bacterium]|nr:MAG: hypothetical protein EOO28_13035 [Comamonadaceae bacterium]